MERRAAPTSTAIPDQTKFLVDSGASMHVMSKTDLSPEELETVKVSRLPATVITANRSVDTTWEATVYVKDLAMFGTVQLLEDTPAVLFFWENPAKKMDMHTSGKKAKTQMLSRMVRLYFAIAITSYLSSFLVYPFKRTSRIQQKIQLKTPRSFHQMITKRRKHREIDCRTCHNF